MDGAGKPSPDEAEGGGGRALASVSPGASSRKDSSKPFTSSGDRLIHSAVANLIVAMRATPSWARTSMSSAGSIPTASPLADSLLYSGSASRCPIASKGHTIDFPNKATQSRAEAGSVTFLNKLRCWKTRLRATMYPSWLSIEGAVEAAAWDLRG